MSLYVVKSDQHLLLLTSTFTSAGFREHFIIESCGVLMMLENNHDWNKMLTSKGIGYVHKDDMVHRADLVV